MQGSQHRERDPAQEDLMAAFLASVDALSPQEAEAETGISWMSITNYRAGKWKYLTARVQRQMRDYLEPRPQDAGPGWDEGYLAAVEEIEAKLVEMRASITGGPPTADELRDRAEGSRPTEDSQRRRA